MKGFTKVVFLSAALAASEGDRLDCELHDGYKHCTAEQSNSDLHIYPEDKSGAELNTALSELEL